jgi:hypothetical protein
VTNTATTSIRNAPVEREFFTGPEVETMFAVSRFALRQWRLIGLRHFGAGKRLRYRLEDVLEFLEQQKEKSEAGR